MKTLKPIMISCSIDSDRTCGHLGFEGAKALFQIDASKISFSSNQNIAGVLANQRAQWKHQFVNRG